MAVGNRRTAELAFPYRSSKRSESVLLQAAGFARSLGMPLAVVVPFVLPAEGPGCCALRGRRWEDMLRDVAAEDAEQARHVLRDANVSHTVTLAEGPSVPDIVKAFASDGDRDLALPRRPSGTVFTRSTLRLTRRLAPGTVHDLGTQPT